MLWSALERGDIDAYPEYTGYDRTGNSGWESFESVEPSCGVSSRSAAWASTEPLGFNNTYALGHAALSGRQSWVSTASRTCAGRRMSRWVHQRVSRPRRRLARPARALRLSPTNVRGLDHDLAYQGLESGDDRRHRPVFDRRGDRVLRHRGPRGRPRLFSAHYEAVFVYRKHPSRTHPNPAAIAASKMLEGRIDEQPHDGHERGGQDRRALRTTRRG